MLRLVIKSTYRLFSSIACLTQLIWVLKCLHWVRSFRKKVQVLLLWKFVLLYSFIILKKRNGLNYLIRTSINHILYKLSYKFYRTRFFYQIIFLLFYFPFSNKYVCWLSVGFSFNINGKLRVLLVQWFIMDWRFLRSCMRRDRVKREVGMADMWTAKETKPVLVVYARRRQARPPFTHPTRKTTMTAAAAAAAVTTTKLGLFQNNYAFFSHLLSSCRNIAAYSALYL